MAGTGDAEVGADSFHYVDYIEGIYVGYRYFELQQQTDSSIMIQRTVSVWLWIKLYHF